MNTPMKLILIFSILFSFFFGGGSAPALAVEEGNGGTTVVTAKESEKEKIYLPSVLHEDGQLELCETGNGMICRIPDSLGGTQDRWVSAQVLEVRNSTCILPNLDLDNSQFQADWSGYVSFREFENTHGYPIVLDSFTNDHGTVLTFSWAFISNFLSDFEENFFVREKLYFAFNCAPTQ